MNYQLSRDGQVLGAYSLEELRQRRQSGELTGAEYVWTEGMADWAALDFVLGQAPPGPQRASPPPIPAAALKSKSNTGVVWAIVGGLVALLVVVLVFGLVAARLGNRYFPALGQSGALRTENENALEIAQKPVTWTSNTLTMVEKQQQQKEFKTRQWVEGYEKRGQHGTPCDTEAHDFLVTWQSRIYDNAAASDLPSTVELAAKLAAQPQCNDPLVLAAIGLNSTSVKTRISILDRALAGFPASKHLAYPQFCAAVTLATEVLRDNPSRVSAVDAMALDLFKKTLTDGGLRPGDESEMAEILINDWGYEFFKRNGAAVNRIAAESKKNLPWLALVVDGEFHIMEAWKARGGGYVDTVKEQGWRDFSSHLAQARAAFEKAWKMHPGLPLAPERLIYVSLGDSGIAEMRRWFDRTVAAQIDYPRAWSDFRWGLRPRWHGDLAAMNAFGLTALNTKRFDTDVPRKYFDVLADLRAEETPGPGENFYARPEFWPHLKEMYEGYIAAPGQAADQRGWRGAYAVVAFLAGKLDVSRAQLELLDWNPRNYNLTGWGVDLSFMPQEVAARTGSAASQVATAEANGDRFDAAGALQIYTNLLAAGNLDRLTSQFVFHRLAILTMERGFQSGDWVPFMPAESDDEGWEQSLGKASSINPRTLEVQSPMGGHFLFSRARLGPDFEVKGSFELAGSGRPTYQAGLIMGHLDPEWKTWYALRFLRSGSTGDTASFSRGWVQNKISQTVKLRDGLNSFTFRLQGGKFSASLNNQEVFTDATPVETIPIRRNDFQIGLGAYNGGGEVVVRYRDVQIRKLPFRFVAPDQ